MKNIIKIVGIIGFFICLFIMYSTNHGIPGIQLFDAEFKLLDMQFHYNASMVNKTFDSIGIEGRTAYRNYLLLDFCFIICFLIVQLSITSRLVSNYTFKNIFFLIAVLRAVFDIIENSTLLFMLMKYPDNNISMANFCSWITTVKFISMYLWVTGILVFIVYNIIHKVAKLT